MLDCFKNDLKDGCDNGLLKSSPFKKKKNQVKFQSSPHVRYLNRSQEIKSVVDQRNYPQDAEGGSIAVGRETAACALKCIGSGERPHHILVPQRNKFVFRPVPKPTRIKVPMISLGC